MLKLIKNGLRTFRDETEGNVTLEAVIVLPALLWLFGVGWVYFDAFHQQSVNQKANYTISDMISRETESIDDTYVTNAYMLFKELTNSTKASSDMRLAVVQYDAASDRWEVQWSRQRGDTLSDEGNGLTDADMVTYRSRLPTGMDAQQLLILETWEDYEPAFDVGLGAFEITTYSFTAPRYAPQIVWEAADDSAGTGSPTDDTSGSSDGTGTGTGTGTDSGSDSGSWWQWWLW